MAVAVVPAPSLATDEQRLERFLELAAWLRKVPGVCWSCAYLFALIQTDREAGEPEPREHYCFSSSKRCREKANAAKAKMPTAGG